MMLKTILPLVLLATLLTGASAARADKLREPLAFHGYVLGTPLDDVRRQGHSDKELRDVRLICNGDTLAKESGKEFRPGERLARLGVKSCHFIHPDTSPQATGRVTTRPRWQEALFQVSRHRLHAVFYFTPPTTDPTTSERLYLIHMKVTPETFDDMAAAVQSQYGPPTTDQTESLRTKSGASLASRIMIWQGAGATIVIKDRVDENDVGGLTYLDLKLGGVVYPDRVSDTPAPTTSRVLSPPSVNGLSLRATLTEVRRQWPPRKSVGKIELICSDDLPEDAGISSELARGTEGEEIGLTACRFFTFDRGKPQEAVLTNDGHATRAKFLFTPKSDALSTSERLYSIRMDTPLGSFDDIAAMYMARFGKPDRDTMTGGRNLTWEDARTMVYLGDRLPDDKVSALYLDMLLNERVEFLKKKTRSGSDKR